MSGHEPQIKISIPAAASRLLGALRRAGFEAYVVGGCVRDSLLGRTPGDWDICTSARPEQVRTVFSAYRQILTGEKHGTVAVIVGGTPYEITTYRVDGQYHDSRHPDAVQFVPQVQPDLARRDFTINAMAYNKATGFVDEFGGVEDLRRGIIRCVGEPMDRFIDLYGGRSDLHACLMRCVGDPEERFAEDALRILRAVRLAAQLDFALEKATERAALDMRQSIQNISAERIYTELDKLLAAPAAGKVLSRYGRILAGAVPEIEPCIGCTQPGRWHCYDVWQHTAVAVELLDVAGMDDKNARILRWSVFLHDLAKPECRTVGPDGAAHFPGHNQAGSKMARSILLRLKAPTYLVESASALVAIHDGALPSDDAGILNMLNRYGAAFLQRLCRLKLADLAAHARNAGVMQREQQVRAFEGRMLELSATACYTVGQLAVNGASLMDAGITPGPAVGKALNTLLRAVMEGRLPNKKAALLAALEKEGLL